MEEKLNFLYRDTFLIPAGILISLIALALAWITSVVFVPFVLIAAAVAVYGYWKTFQHTYIWIVLIAMASLMGNTVALTDEGPIPFSLFQLGLFAAFLTIFLQRIIDGNFEIRLTGLELMLALFTALIFLSLLWSPEHEDGFVRAIRLLVSVGFLYLVVNEVHTRKQIIYILSGMVLVAFLLSAFSIYQNLTNVEDTVRNVLGGGAFLKGRVTGTVWDPNVFASMLLVPIAFTACVVLSETSLKYKLPAMFMLAITLGGIIVTYSRSAWVGAIVMFLIITWYYRNVRLYAYLGIILALILIAFPQISLTLISAAQRFLDITAGASDDSSRIRLVLGLAAINMFVDSYFLGVGFRGYIAHFTEYYSLQETLGVYEPHNIFYTILAELGIVGFTIYLIILFKIGYTAWRNIGLAETNSEKIIAVTCFSSFFAYLVFYQFYGGGLADNNLWLLIGLIYAFHYSRESLKPFLKSSA